MSVAERGRVRFNYLLNPFHVDGVRWHSGSPRWDLFIAVEGSPYERFASCPEDDLGECLSGLQKIGGMGAESCS